jgi:hypothetical protein
MTTTQHYSPLLTKIALALSLVALPAFGTDLPPTPSTIQPICSYDFITDRDESFSITIAGHDECIWYKAPDSDYFIEHILPKTGLNIALTKHGIVPTEYADANEQRLTVDEWLIQECFPPRNLITLSTKSKEVLQASIAILHQIAEQQAQERKAFYS